MTFKLEIELGNEAMQSPGEVALALTEVVRRLASPSIADCFGDGGAGTEGVIRAENGNRVGSWEVSCHKCGIVAEFGPTAQAARELHGLVDAGWVFLANLNRFKKPHTDVEAFKKALIRARAAT